MSEYPELTYMGLALVVILGFVAGVVLGLGVQSARIRALRRDLAYFKKEMKEWMALVFKKPAKDVSDDDVAKSVILRSKSTHLRGVAK